jgi:hypothetical protein
MTHRAFPKTDGSGWYAYDVAPSDDDATCHYPVGYGATATAALTELAWLIETLHDHDPLWHVVIRS